MKSAFWNLSGGRTQSQYECCSLCHTPYEIFYGQNNGAAQMHKCATFVVQHEGVKTFEPLDMGSYGQWVVLYAAYGSMFDMDLMLCSYTSLKSILDVSKTLNEVVICDSCIAQLSAQKKCIVLLSSEHKAGKDLEFYSRAYYQYSANSQERRDIQIKLMEAWKLYQNKLKRVWKKSANRIFYV